MDDSQSNSIGIWNICDHMETLRIRLAAICLWKLIPFEQIWKFLLKSFPCEKFWLDPSYRKMTNLFSIAMHCFNECSKLKLNDA